MNQQPPDNDSDAASDLSLVQALLPLHAQSLLQGEQLTFMNQWLGSNMDQYPDIKADLAWLSTTAIQLKRGAANDVSAAQPQLDAGLNILMSRIVAEQACQPGFAIAHGKAGLQNNWFTWLVTWVNEALGIGTQGFAMAAAMLVLVQAAVIGALFVHQPAQQTVLSGSANASSNEAVTVLTVAFNPAVTELNIRQTLAVANAQIISGPSALGLYSVSVKTTDLAASLSTLRSTKGVVESVTQ